MTKNNDRCIPKLEENRDGGDKVDEDAQHGRDKDEVEHALR